MSSIRKDAVRNKKMSTKENYQGYNPNISYISMTYADVFLHLFY